MNPNRVCRICKEYAEAPQTPLPDLMKALGGLIITKSENRFNVYGCETYVIENEKEAIDKLREAANGCPACMLAAIRRLDCPAGALTFSYKNEKEEFWAYYNDSQRQVGYY